MGEGSRAKPLPLAKRSFGRVRALAKHRVRCERNVFMVSVNGLDSNKCKAKRTAQTSYDKRNQTSRWVQHDYIQEKITLIHVVRASLCVQSANEIEKWLPTVVALTGIVPGRIRIARIYMTENTAHMDVNFEFLPDIIFIFLYTMSQQRAMHNS